MKKSSLPPEQLSFFDLENLYKFYQNAYGHFKPAGQNGLAPSLESVVPRPKLQYIQAINTAYLAHPNRFTQAKLF